MICVELVGGGLMKERKDKFQKECPKCGCMMGRVFAFETWYWYCAKCIRGYPKSVEEGNNDRAVV